MRSLVPLFALLQSGSWWRALVPLYALWAVIGWCGTPYPGWWPRPQPPDPEPWWRPRLIGVVAGLVGGWVFTQVFGPEPQPWSSALQVAATAVGAFGASRVVGDLYQIARGAGQARG